MAQAQQTTKAQGVAKTGSVVDAVDVALPAGGRISGAFAEQAGTDIKALIRLNGETILARTITMLRETGRVGRIVVIGPQAALDEATRNGADATLLEGASGPDNILAGLRTIQEQNGGPTNRALIMATDLPFVTPNALTAFLDACPPDADVVIPAVRAQEFDARFPDSHAVYVNLADGRFTLGCAFLVNPESILRNEAHLRRIFAARKSQIQMARLVGPRTIFRLLTKRLTVPEITARASAILQCRGAVVLPAPAELAYDIDLPEEYAYARDHAAQFTRRVSAPTPAASERLAR